MQTNNRINVSIRPVKTDAEHAVVPERGHEEVLVLPALPEHRQGPVTQ